MDGHTSPHGDEEKRSKMYRLKVELRHEERADRTDSPYARALRHALHAFSEHTLEDAVVLLEDELLDLEQRDGDDGAADGLRRALTVVEGAPKANRELFQYYLRKMEAEGRADEPFAVALRRVLSTPGRASLSDFFRWKKEAEKEE